MQHFNYNFIRLENRSAVVPRISSCLFVHSCTSSVHRSPSPQLFPHLNLRAIRRLKYRTRNVRTETYYMHSSEATKLSITERPSSDRVFLNMYERLSLQAHQHETIRVSLQCFVLAAYFHIFSHNTLLSHSPQSLSSILPL